MQFPLLLPGTSLRAVSRLTCTPQPHGSACRTSPSMSCSPADLQFVCLTCWQASQPVTPGVWTPSALPCRICPTSPGSEGMPLATAVHIFQLGRGVTPAVIQSVAFSSSGEWLAANSARGTTHVYRCAHIPCCLLHGPQSLLCCHQQQPTICAPEPIRLHLGLCTKPPVLPAACPNIIPASKLSSEACCAAGLCHEGQSAAACHACKLALPLTRCCRAWCVIHWVICSRPPAFRL